MSSAPNINISEFHEARRRRRLRFILISALGAIVFIAAGAGWIILRSPVFSISRVEITGNKTVPNGEILGLILSNIVEGQFTRALLGVDNILLWPDKFSEKELALLPAVRGVEIDKNFQTRSVAVKVNEREPYGIWCLEALNNAEQTENGAENSAASSSSATTPASDNCFWFDNAGVIFKRALSARGSLIMTVDDYSQKGLGLGSKILPERFISNLFSVFDALHASGVSIKEVRLNDLSLEELQVLTYDGPKLYFSLRFSAENAAAVVESLMSKAGFKNLQYLDFRVENRVYYR